MPAPKGVPQQKPPNQGIRITRGKAAAAKARAEAQAKEDAAHSPAWRASKAIKPTKRVKAARAKKRIPKDEAARLAAYREKMHKEHEAAKKVQITLKTYHQFNDTIYGPGHVWVPQGLVSALLEQDRHAQEAEAQLFVERSNIIGAGNRVIPVANPNFDMVWAGERPIIYDAISGKGIVDGGQGPSF